LPGGARQGDGSAVPPVQKKPIGHSWEALDDVPLPYRSTNTLRMLVWVARESFKSQALQFCMEGKIQRQGGSMLSTRMTAEGPDSGGYGIIQGYNAGMGKPVGHWALTKDLGPVLTWGSKNLEKRYTGPYRPHRLYSSSQ
jgi:hypothetical protein